MHFTFYIQCQLANSRSPICASLFIRCTPQKPVLPWGCDVLFRVQSCLRLCPVLASVVFPLYYTIKVQTPANLLMRPFSAWALHAAITHPQFSSPAELAASRVSVLLLQVNEACIGKHFSLWSFRITSWLNQNRFFSKILTFRLLILQLQVPFLVIWETILPKLHCRASER